jgi:hypothetical protein
MEEIDGLQVDLGRLPAELQSLAPLIREWATLDDDARERRLESASTEDLAQFWLAISPELPAINAYLERQAAGGQESPEAVAVAATAEAALGASQVIERRTGSPAGDDDAA